MYKTIIKIKAEAFHNFLIWNYIKESKTHRSLKVFYNIISVVEGIRDHLRLEIVALFVLQARFVDAYYSYSPRPLEPGTFCKNV